MRTLKVIGAAHELSLGLARRFTFSIEENDLSACFTHIKRSYPEFSAESNRRTQLFYASCKPVVIRSQ